MTAPGEKVDGTSADNNDGRDHDATDPEALVRRYYERVDAEDVEGLLALFAETVTYDRPGQDAIEGRAELRDFYERGRPLEDGAHSLDAVIVDENDGGKGDRVAVRGQFSGTQDGESVSFGFADFHELNDEGVIAKRWSFTDRDTV